MKLSVPIKIAALVTSAAWLCVAYGAPPQTIFRIVGPDGKVTFSDKPPVSAEQGKIASTGTGAVAAASSTALPFELRQVVSKYPVTLYSAPDCSPCANGRAMLSSRGIPFSERSVTTNEDIAALQRLAGESSLPYLTIGGQRLKGYSEQEWTQYLDLAGYPKTSVLPAGYKPEGVAPLVSIQKPAPVKEEPKPEVAPEPKVPTGPAPSNPAGITF
jgi:glutaredoxin